MLYTSLNEIKAQKPCEESYKQILRSMKKTKADDEPIDMIDVLQSNGAAQTFYMLRCIQGADTQIKLLLCRIAGDCAEPLNEYPAFSKGVSLRKAGLISGQQLSAFDDVYAEIARLSHAIMDEKQRNAAWAVYWAMSEDITGSASVAVFEHAVAAFDDKTAAEEKFAMYLRDTLEA